MMNPTDMNRRRFLETVATTSTVAVSSTALAQAEPSRIGPNDTINMALIGCGARGRNQVMPSFMELPGVKFTAVCDVNSINLEKGKQKAGGSSVKAYRDFRELLADSSIDAVIVATQAHWHVPIAVAACQAGKDVYVEKPLGNFIGEGRYLIEAAKKYDRIVQIGTQQHSMEHYRKAVEIIQSGKLGAISEVKVWDHTYWAPGRGNPADCDPPPELDWDFYVGPSPMQNYNPNIYYDYGYDWFRLSGGGHQVAWGVHHFDIVNWAMGVKYPKRVSAFGGHFAYQDNFEYPNTFDAIMEFGPGPVAENGFLLQYTMRMGSRRVRRSHAKCFYGTEATMVLDRSRISIAAEPKSRKSQNEAGYLLSPEEEIVSSDDAFRHSQVFIDNVRNRTQPETDAQTGHYATNLGHLMNVSWEVGRSIEWDGERELVVGDDEANKFVHKEYRDPWKLTV
jgi:predicted dehydrogenase